MADAPAERRPVTDRALGDSGIDVFPIALGTSVFGWTVDRGMSLRILDRFSELGGTLIDTADNYAAGQSEVMIGNWMRFRRSRDAVRIATKVGRGSEYPGLSRAGIIAAVDASLERMRTDRIDVLYFHLDDEGTPLEESLSAAGELIAAGKVLSLGASNFRAHRLMEARVLTAYGLPRFESIQEHYNMMRRAEVEGDIALVAQAQGLSVLPHFALAHGFLAGEYRRRADGIGNARRARAGQYLNRRGMRVLSVLDRIAAQQGVSNAQIALAWLHAKPGVVAPVVSADTLAHVDEMMSSPAIELTPGQLEELDRVSAVTRSTSRD
ncbi:aldo/keto reductase, partial [Leucobacter sp. M11]|uniref:aldo/keto reductase n=1 Tax=Leucobacter sp. M11 TaxID=2993565 RepID=UPI002D80B1D0